MKEIFIRLSNPSPSFFKKIQALGLIATAVGGVLASPLGVTLPAFFTNISGYLMTAGLIAAAIAKVTVADNSVLPEKKD